MSKLDDILGTTEIAKRYPAEYGNKKTQLQKQLIKDLMLELIDSAHHWTYENTEYVTEEDLIQAVNEL